MANERCQCGALATHNEGGIRLCCDHCCQHKTTSKPRQSLFYPNTLVSLSPDEVALTLGLVQADLDDCHEADVPFDYIRAACNDASFEDDAIADTRYVARLAIISQKLQGTF